MASTQPPKPRLRSQAACRRCREKHNIHCGGGLVCEPCTSSGSDCIYEPVFAPLVRKKHNKRFLARVAAAENAYLIQRIRFLELAVGAIEPGPAFEASGPADGDDRRDSVVCGATVFAADMPEVSFNMCMLSLKEIGHVRACVSAILPASPLFSGVALPSLVALFEHHGHVDGESELHRGSMSLNAESYMIVNAALTFGAWWHRDFDDARVYLNRGGQAFVHIACRRSWEGVIALSLYGLLCSYLMHRSSSLAFYQAADVVLSSLEESPALATCIDRAFVFRLHMSRHALNVMVFKQPPDSVGIMGSVGASVGGTIPNNASSDGRHGVPGTVSHGGGDDSRASGDSESDNVGDFKQPPDSAVSMIQPQCTTYHSFTILEHCKLMTAILTTVRTRGRTHASVEWLQFCDDAASNAQCAIARCLASPRDEDSEQLPQYAEPLLFALRCTLSSINGDCAACAEWGLKAVARFTAMPQLSLMDVCACSTLLESLVEFKVHETARVLFEALRPHANVWPFTAYVFHRQLKKLAATRAAAGLSAVLGEVPTSRHSDLAAVVPTALQRPVTGDGTTVGTGASRRPRKIRRPSESSGSDNPSGGSGAAVTVTPTPLAATMQPTASSHHPDGLHTFDGEPVGSLDPLDDALLASMFEADAYEVDLNTLFADL